MNQIIALKPVERAEVFTQAGIELGLPAFYVEKDFWVCWVLERLFGDDQMRPYLTFRGGTSLSKGWGLIERFSEDVDLAMSRRWVDAALPNPAERGISRAQREARLKQLRRTCRVAIDEQVLPRLEEEVKQLGDGAEVRAMGLKQARDPFVIDLHYPAGAFEVPGDYHRAIVKIELSGRADDWPQAERVIRPFVEDALPQLQMQTSIKVACVTPARTFWEKAALLHERYAQKDRIQPGVRQARHLYDLVQLWKNVQDETGLVDLFDGVKLHRKTFFNYGGIDYDTLKPSDLILVPPADQISAWRSDYQAMKAMFIGEPVAFNHLMQSIAQIESALKALG